MVYISEVVSMIQLDERMGFKMTGVHAIE